MCAAEDVVCEETHTAWRLAQVVCVSAQDVCERAHDVCEGEDVVREETNRRIDSSDLTP